MNRDIRQRRLQVLSELITISSFSETLASKT